MNAGQKTGTRQQQNSKEDPEKTEITTSTPGSSLPSIFVTKHPPQWTPEHPPEEKPGSHHTMDGKSIIAHRALETSAVAPKSRLRCGSSAGANPGTPLAPGPPSSITRTRLPLRTRRPPTANPMLNHHSALHTPTPPSQGRPEPALKQGSACFPSKRKSRRHHLLALSKKKGRQSSGQATATAGCRSHGRHEAPEHPSSRTNPPDGASTSLPTATERAPPERGPSREDLIPV